MIAVLLLGLSGSTAVFAQSSVGGRTLKQGYIGGPVKQSSAVVAAPRVGAAPVAPVISAPVAAPVRPKCPGGNCVAKGSIR